MAKQKTFYPKFRGKAAWMHHLIVPDTYLGSSRWKMNFYLDKETKKEIKDIGIKSRVNYDDGESSGVSGEFIVLKRDTEKEFSGKIQKFKPVEVKLQGKNYFDWVEENGVWQLKEEVAVPGNGSEVEVTLEVYDTERYGFGSRLVAVDILDFIEYEKPEEVSPEEPEDDTPPFDVEEVEEKTQTKKPKVTW